MSGAEGAHLPEETQVTELTSAPRTLEERV